MSISGNRPIPRTANGSSRRPRRDTRASAKSLQPEQLPPIVGRMPAVECTVARSELHHYISDHELRALGEADHGWLVALFWMALGAFLSALPAASEAVSRLSASPPSLGSEGAVAIIVSVASLAVVFVAGCAGRGRGGNKAATLAEIQARPKIQIRDGMPTAQASN